MFDRVGGLPLHPLVIHATVVLITMSCIGVVALTVVPRLRHRYGYLLLFGEVLALLVTWIAVESGEYLTSLPGLGSTEHADGGRALFRLMFPFVGVSALMITLDRLWFVRKNKHGTTYRAPPRETEVLVIPGEATTREWIVYAVGMVAVVCAIAVFLQTMAVGHSGAEATWLNSR